MPAFISIILIILIAILITSWILSNFVVKPLVLNNKVLYNLEIKEGRLDEDLYNSWEKKEFTIKSRYGYELSCMQIDNEKSKKQLSNLDKKIKIAILCHGYTRSKLSTSVYAKFFLNRGITVITYDHRNHGLSGKAHTSMGYYEKYDLQTVVDWCYINYNSNVSIITHGESMGAATVLSHLGVDTRVYLAIADCGYSDFPELAKYLFKRRFLLPKFPFVYISALLVKLRAGFKVQDVSPIETVAVTKKPVLFIHGQADTFIPCSMSQDMYKAKADNKDILIVPEAEHGLSAVVDPVTYENKLNEFLDKYNY